MGVTTTMAYTRGIPFASQSTAVWQKQERRNGFVRDEVIGEEHYPPSDPVNGGKHRKFTLPNQVGDPTTLADEYALYSKEAGGVKSIYIREPSNGTVSSIISDDTFGSVQRMGDFVLGASCSWDFKGNLFNSYNCANITVTDAIPPTLRTYQINFTNTLPTDDFFWTVSFFNGVSGSNTNPSALINGIFVTADGTYNNSISDSFIKFTVFNTLSGLTQPRNKFTLKVWLLA